MIEPKLPEKKGKNQERANNNTDGKRKKQTPVLYQLLSQKCANLGNELGEAGVGFTIDAALGIDSIVGDDPGLNS